MMLWFVAISCTQRRRHLKVKQFTDEKKTHFKSIILQWLLSLLQSKTVTAAAKTSATS